MSKTLVKRLKLTWESVICMKSISKCVWVTGWEELSSVVTKSWHLMIACFYYIWALLDLFPVVWKVQKNPKLGLWSLSCYNSYNQSLPGMSGPQFPHLHKWGTWPRTVVIIFCFLIDFLFPNKCLSSFQIVMLIKWQHDKYQKNKDIFPWALKFMFYWSLKTSGKWH